MQFLGHSNRLILLAEDDTDDHELLKNAFNEIDPAWQVHCIANGKKFVQHLDTIQDDQLPALLVLDYNIPELTGVEIVEALNHRGRYLGIPKVIWSTSASPVYKAKSIELGVADYVIKPSDIASFRDIAQHMLSFIKS
ncbi:response regulator [Chitinophaga horti]|uniref:Response regulator n=1 Tax=Chitinophaga horti TaxID=2920382 RepID=A0ABY6J0A5_9BACT|nr:response regulator [Chitinophaga horti]UYQ91754.1 response regulator [Chitinophaga horti]